MVERPIKKADRQPQTENNDSTNAKRSDDSDKKRSNSGGGREKRDKRGSRDEEPKAPVNLALVRGPKPTKPQPALAEEEVIPEVVEVVEEITEA